MIHLSVGLRLPDGAEVRAGEIRVAGPDAARGGRLQGEFRYDAAYLSSPAAFALDPLHLPLTRDAQPAHRPKAGLQGIFEDALPDVWGRSLLIRRFKLPPGQQLPAQMLALLGRECLGALFFSETPLCPQQVASPSCSLEALVGAAEAYDRDPGALNESDLSLLFRAASSPGGARPKVLLELDQCHWIGKLSSSRDPVNLVRVEAACLALARDAGLEVPAFRLERIGAHDILLVRRFDVTAQGGRNHVASMQTLLGAEGYYQLGYSDMADVVRRVSCVPERDLPALYRQSLFNAVLGNTDDHLKNFAMLRDAAGWKLTPAYDLVPDVPQRGEHVLHFGSAGYRPTAASLQTLAAQFGLSKKQAGVIVTEVAAACRNWRIPFQAFGVPDDEMVRLARDIDARQGLLSRA